MIKSQHTSILKYSLLLLFFILNSCSKDDTLGETNDNISVQTSNFSVIVENHPENGQVLGIVEGSTNEGTVSFSINSQNPAGAFAINSETGELTVTNSELFNHEM